MKSHDLYFVAEPDYDYVEPRHHAMRLLSEGVISVLGHGNVSGTKVVVALVPEVQRSKMFVSRGFPDPLRFHGF